MNLILRNILLSIAMLSFLECFLLPGCRSFKDGGIGEVSPSIKDAYKRVVDFENEIVSGSGRITIINMASLVEEGISPMSQLAIYQRELDDMIQQDRLKRRSLAPLKRQLRFNYFDPLIAEFGVTYSLAEDQKSFETPVYGIQDLILRAKQGKVAATRLFTQRYRIEASSLESR